jgi:phytoene dehydrogenase-like protein
VTSPCWKPRRRGANRARTEIALHRDLDATVESLEPRRRETVLRAALSPFPPVRPGLALAARLRRDGVELARGMPASSATMGREVLGDERAAAWLSGSVAHGDLTPGSAGGAGFAFFLALLGHAVGWPYPRGGAGASVHPGGGVHGVSGHAAARAVLADASPLRFWR